MYKNKKKGVSEYSLVSLGGDFISIIHRKERIVFTAIEVIHELGVMGLSTKKIAEYESISESTVFKHFQSKNAILLSVLDFYAKFDEDIIESIYLKEKVGLEALRFFLETFATYYENYPSITAITQGLDEMGRNKALLEKVRFINTYRYKNMVRIIEQGIDNCEIRAGYDAGLIAEIILGYTNGIVRQWRSSGYDFDLKKRILDATDFCFNWDVKRGE